MELHCVFCGATLQVNHILFAREDEAMQAKRLAFELEHNGRHGSEKTIGMILDLPDAKESNGADQHLP